MKSINIAFFLLLPPSALAIKCGRPLTTACLGDTDIRYDPDSSNSAIDQDPVWRRMQGLFRGEGQVRFEINFGPVPATPSDNIVTLPFTVFWNFTTVGSRQYSREYAIYFGNIRPPSHRNAFSTTTYEKDGTVIFLPTVLTYSNNSEVTLLVKPSEMSRSYPVDNNTVYFTGPTSTDLVGLQSSTQVCLDDGCNQIHATSDSFVPINGTIERNFAIEVSYTRINTKEEFFSQINATYIANNVPEGQQIPPSEDPCALGLCPTEEQWCQSDPNCSESPYQEPPASVKPGAIAGFVIAGVVLLVAVLYAIHLILQKQQERRFRTIFAKRIAETIKVRGSMRTLSPEALADEFRRIDQGVQDGKLSREELWEFISSGKAGEMDKKDFDALFAAIDLDKSGSVDFLEFCAFMGKCDDEYRAARREGGSSVVASSRRLDTATTTARRLSSLHQVGSSEPDRDEKVEEEGMIG